MRKFILTLIVAMAACGTLLAQTLQEEEVLGETAAVDTLLAGCSIYAALPSCVTVNASSSVREALDRMILGNESRMFSGYRVRIYQSSTQTAREESLGAFRRFNAMMPDVPVYRSYTAPFFKVMAGNYRTRLDAEQALAAIRNDFPGAVVVREKFKYPCF